ncbi:MAG: trigger factor [Saccharofermentanaceae bacterium]|jgi:trigger factor|nr:trigger factor [Clostridia bacterium]NLX68390.1 trigger factor [Clostridiaceae bacterium]HOO49287.1 trigger factor [Saccharofermentans sp.]HPE28274.1 trigger factor [Saccharofermentans sp.]HPQ31648.1 trigger factor [Saccharofermentans sp.]
MASTIEKKENNIVEISLEATREEFEAALKQSYNKNKGKFQIQGFRKGKVPYQLVIQYYGEGVLYDDAIEFIASPAYVEAVKEHDLKVVSRPDLSIDEIGENGMKYKLAVSVKPEFELGQYEGVEVPYSVREVNDTTVSEEIERMLKRNASLEEIKDRAVENGDTAVIDYEGFKDGVAFEGGKGENYSLKIGSKSFIPGFEEQIIGHNVGDEFAIEVTFPEEYHSEDLKGAAATFNVKLHTIKCEKLPELDDEFAKDVSEFDTLDELKADIKKKQEDSAQKEAKAAFENAVITAVSENTEIDIPDSMVDTEIDQMVNEQNSRMSQQGINLDMYLKYVGQSMDEYKASLKPMAKIRVKSNLVIEKIASVINMEATKEDYDKEVEIIAESYKMSKEDIAKSLGEDNEYLKEAIISRKTVEYIASKAVKTEPKEEKTDDDKKA